MFGTWCVCVYIYEQILQSFLRIISYVVHFSEIEINMEMLIALENYTHDSQITIERCEVAFEQNSSWAYRRLS